MSAITTPQRSQVVVAVLLAALGFAAIVQVKDNDSADAYKGLRESELIEVLDGLTGTAQRAREEITRLEETRSKLQSQSSARQAALTEAQQRARNLSILAGTLKIGGPGVRVTITPGPAIGVGVGPLLDTVQELRTAGAEGIEFNDEVRVVAQSSFESGEDGVRLDGVLLRPPYVVEAIGDPHVLATGLRFSGGPVEALERDGATVGIAELDSIEIASTRDLPAMANTTPDVDE